MRERKRLGDILMSAGKLTVAQLNAALEVQSRTKKRIGAVLIDEGILSESEIIDTLSQQLSIKRIDIDNTYVEPEIARSIPKEVAKKHNLIPVNLQDGKLIVAMSDPLNVFAIDDVCFITQKKVEPVIATKSSIEKAIEFYFGKQATDKAIEDLKKEYGISAETKIDAGETDDVQSAPAVRLSNSIINQAINMSASDIHIEPYESYVSVRYRVDGVLFESNRIPENLYSAVSTRIKIMSGMNIAEKRVPQDGRIEMSMNGKSFDFRVSSLPTVFGEKIVIRVLDRTTFNYNREKLGFTAVENELMDKIIHMPYGIVLLTGPTGSGKTTTLYTMLNEVNTPDKNIVTVEDPVEYMLEGINQVQVNNKAGLTFAAGLRSILRQDPDIIMIGEIRDEETAQIAVRAAITGHLVLSTLHTNDAPGAMTRLVDMGIEPYLAADAVVGVIAQRLVRRLCASCRTSYISDENEMKLLNIDKPARLYKAEGCPTCHGSGYKGRTAIHEVMLIGREMRRIIEQKGNAEELRETAVKEGMVNLFENCRSLVLKGETTIQEMVKTVYARD
ncbi:MAG TPA: ATPase, T2SS/T4P/T4SS family [Clostridia bacterium]|nr:ATPase, T2SS/T4P/T4SS family [Clostridia bacterium]